MVHVSIALDALSIILVSMVLFCLINNPWGFLTPPDKGGDSLGRPCPFGVSSVDWLELVSEPRIGLKPGQFNFPVCVSNSPPVK